MKQELPGIWTEDIYGKQGYLLTLEELKEFAHEWYDRGYEVVTEPQEYKDDFKSNWDEKYGNE